jgi:hypothetical protein
LDLVAKIGGFTAGMDAAARATDKRTRQMERRVNDFGKKLATAAKVAAGVFAGLVGIYIKNTIEAEKVQAQLASRIKDTGGIAGRTLAQLNEQAQKLQALTVFDDETIGGVQAMLLTFKQVQGVNFDRATGAVLDLATAMGTDANSAALQLGKALNDPIKGLTALGRMGVQFSDDQKKVIKALVDTGDVAGAQRVILKELEGQMGTAAEAARDTLGGAFEGLKNTVNNLLEGDSSQGGLRGAKVAVDDLNKSLNDPGVKQGIDRIVTGMLTAIGVMARFVSTTASTAHFLGEELAARVSGTSVDDLVRINDRIVRLKETIAAVQKQGLAHPLSVMDSTELIPKDFISSKDTVLARLQKELDKEQNKLKINADINLNVQSAASAVVAAATGAITTPAPPPSPAPIVGNPTAPGSDSHAQALRDAADATRALAEADADLYGQSLANVDATSKGMIAWAGLTAELDGPLKQAELDHLQRMQDIEEAGRAAGVTADAIVAAKEKETEAYNKATDAIREQQAAMANPEAVGLMDDFRYAASNMLTDIVTGAKSAKDAIGDFFDTIAQEITAAISKHWIEQLFGPMGSTGESTSGGAGLFSFFAGLLGGKREHGGPVSAGHLYEVGEHDRAETFVSGGKRYLIPGNNGSVIPGGGGMTQNIQFLLPATITPKTQSQIAQRTAVAGQRAATRNR